MTKRRVRRSSDAFTLIELTRRHRHHRGIDRPAVAGRAVCSRSGAPCASCINNLKQIGLAMHNFENSRLVLPPTWAISTALLQPPYQPAATLTTISP